MMTTAATPAPAKINVLLFCFSGINCDSTTCSVNCDEKTDSTSSTVSFTNFVMSSCSSVKPDGTTTKSSSTSALPPNTIKPLSSSSSRLGISVITKSSRSFSGSAAGVVGFISATTDGFLSSV